MPKKRQPQSSDTPDSATTAVAEPPNGKTPKVDPFKHSGDIESVAKLIARAVHQRISQDQPDLPQHGKSYLAFVRGLARRLLPDVQRAVADFSCCAYTGTGRGDCENFIGLPGQERDTTHDGPNTEDVYGRPNGWCWSCWKNYRMLQAQRAARLKGEAIAKLEMKIKAHELVLTATTMGRRANMLGKLLAAADAYIGFLMGVAVGLGKERESLYDESWADRRAEVAELLDKLGGEVETS